jgi:RNA polymerase sigma factor (sigma-70 family)
VRNPDDVEAWHEFQVQYRDLVLVYCGRRGLQRADADDVFQTVMLSLARALPAFHYKASRGRFRHYLGQVVRREVHRHRARPIIGTDLLEGYGLDSLVDHDDVLDEQWEQEWVNHHYRQALREISKGFDARSVAVFSDLLSGQSVAEITQRDGLSADAVYKIRRRVRVRLQEQIEQQILEEDEPRGIPDQSES